MGANAELRSTKFGEILTMTWGGHVVEVIRFEREGRDHVHDKTEHAICLSGPCELLLNNKPFAMAEFHHQYKIPADVPHRMRPTTDEPSLWIIWYSDSPKSIEGLRAEAVQSWIGL